MTLFEPNWSRKRLTGQLTWFVSWVIITFLGAVVLKPEVAGHGTHQQLGLPACPSAAIFDRPCPGCGLTTSWTNTLHGQFAAAFQDHWLGPFLYIVFTLSAFACIYGWYAGKKFVTDNKAGNWFLGSIAVLVMVYGVARFATFRYSKNVGPMESAIEAQREISK